MPHTNSRRSFLKYMIAGAVAVPLTSKLGDASADTPQIPNKPVPPTDRMAVSVGYVTDATTVDTSQFPQYQSGQICKNCLLYLEGDKIVEAAPGEHGRCGLFVSGLVAATGWCNSYAQRIEIPEAGV